jgi:hypothetical protein
VRCVAELQTSYIVRSLKWRRGVCAGALRTCNHPSRRRPDLKYYEMMSRPWNPSLYRSMHNQSPPPDAVEVEGLMQAIEEFGERLRTQPYDTMAWLQRARCFLTINYPELAASDAYKASMLIDRETQTLSEDSDATRTKIYDVLGQALYDCHCHWELEEFWQDVASKHPSDHARKKLKDINELMVRKASAAVPAEYEHERRDRLRDGGVLTVDYPWLQEQHRVRSPELVEAINQELTHSNGDRVCYLASSTLAPASDMLGIFAARNLEKGETILVDRTAMAACSNPDTGSCSNCFGLISTPVETKCCSAIYCASECRDVTIHLSQNDLWTGLFLASVSRTRTTLERFAASTASHVANHCHSRTIWYPSTVPSTHSAPPTPLKRRTHGRIHFQRVNQDTYSDTTTTRH